MSKTLNFELALEILDGLCEQMGAVGVERDNVMAYDDDKLVGLFDVYSLLHGLYRDADVIRQVIRETREIKRQDGPPFKGALSQLLFDGDAEGIQLAREYVHRIAGG